MSPALFVLSSQERWARHVQLPRNSYISLSRSIRVINTHRDITSLSYPHSQPIHSNSNSSPSPGADFYLLWRLFFGCYSLLCDETLRFHWKLGVSFTCRNIQPSDFWSWSVASGLMRVACSCRWCLVFRWVRSFRTFRLFLLVIHHSFLALNANTHPPCALVKHWPFFRQRGLEFPQFQLFTILAKYLPPRSTIAGLTGVLF